MNAVGFNTRKPTTNSISSNFTVRENLTSFRKCLLNEAKKVQRSLNYKFVWTLQGQIFIRQRDNSSAIKISTLRDQDKLNALQWGVGSVIIKILLGMLSVIFFFNIVNFTYVFCLIFSGAV